MDVSVTRATARFLAAFDVAVWTRIVSKGYDMALPGQRSGQ